MICSDSLSPFGDRLALLGDALALQAHRLLLALGLHDRQSLLGVALGGRRDLIALRRIDVVHRVLDPLVGLDVGDQRLDDLVAVLGHLAVQRVLDVHRDRVGVGVGLVQTHAGDVRPNDVERIGLDLDLRVVELVVRVLHLLGVGADLVLDGKLDADEDVVLRLRLDLGVELLDLQAHPSGDALDERRFGLQPRAAHAHELSEALDDRSLLLLDRKEKQWHRDSPFRGVEIGRRRPASRPGLTIVHRFAGYVSFNTRRPVTITGVPSVLMGSDAEPESLVGLVADERLLSEDPALLPAELGLPEPIPASAVRRRLVAVGVALTGLTLIGGIALAILGAVELLFSGGGALAAVALVVGLVLAGTHWGWVHVAEVSSLGIERRSNAGVVDRRQAWLEAIAPFTRYEVRTNAGDDGTITIERVRYRPIRSGDRTFVFERSVEHAEAHAGDDPAAVVAERAELLRHRAAVDTERERAGFQEQADALNWAALAEGEDRERTREQADAARALSEQINANLREPPLTE